jgi:hypothetical protein
VENPHDRNSRSDACLQAATNQINKVNVTVETLVGDTGFEPVTPIV